VGAQTFKDAASSRHERQRLSVVFVLCNDRFQRVLHPRSSACKVEKAWLAQQRGVRALIQEFRLCCDLGVKLLRTTDAYDKLNARKVAFVQCKIDRYLLERWPLNLIVKTNSKSCLHSNLLFEVSFR